KRPQAPQNPKKPKRPNAMLRSSHRRCTGRALAATLLAVAMPLMSCNCWYIEREGGDVGVLQRSGDATCVLQQLVHRERWR
ncbi:Hypothetical predicted protein, partial [Olea europaea subsp. europaea]